LLTDLNKAEAQVYIQVGLYKRTNTDAASGTKVQILTQVEYIQITSAATISSSSCSRCVCMQYTC
jgi:hypothetical protein